MMADGSVATMDVETLQPLSNSAADFLSAISNPDERLNCFLEKQGLDAAMKARPGQRVFVDLDQQTFPGIITYIGKLHRRVLPAGLWPVYFGVELQVGLIKDARIVGPINNELFNLFINDPGYGMKGVCMECEGDTKLVG